ncbi:hypothetical protein BOH72_26300 [Mycobacterium sp. WY10]|nr:hypothetical protein BOH72_26300 [Mycobacterium sp. WY10]
MLKLLDAPQPALHRLDRYYRGASPQLAYLSAEAKRNLSKFEVLSANLCRVAVVAIQERLRVAGWTGDDEAMDLWLGSDLDQISDSVHRAALTWGQTYMLVWRDKRGRARATHEPPTHMAIRRDPVTREIVRAVKKINTSTSTEVWLYGPDEVLHYRGSTTNATTFDLVDSTPNPMGVTPVVAIGLDDDDSVIADLIPVQDAAAKMCTDMMAASEAAGRPQRFASGIEAAERPILDAEGNDTGEVEVVNPLPENSNRTWLAEDATAKFGQLTGSDLAGFEAGMRVIMAAAMTVTSLPPSYFGLLQDSVTSADGIRAAESALVARVEQKARAYGTGWEAVMRLLIAVDRGVDPLDVVVKVAWSAPDTRSVAQEADAAVKLYQAGLLSREETLRRVGMTDDEITAELARINRDVADARDLTLGRYMAGQTDR